MKWEDRKPSGCVSCGNPISSEDNPWIEMVGYARPREQRGGQSGSSLVSRSPTGRAMCGSCAVDALHGIDRQQGAMF